MGNCLSESYCSPHSKDQYPNSKLIDRQLKDSQRRMQREVKILLLGAGESGKTTVLKQMEIFHTPGGFSASRKEDYRREIFKNVFDGMRLCLEIMSVENIGLEDETLMDVLPLFTSGSKRLEPGEPYPADYHKPLLRLWADKGVRKALDNRIGWAVPESMQHFGSQLNRLFDPLYVPTEQDILQCRGKSRGVTEFAFEATGFNYRVIDVGGQRSERKKWIHCFEDVTAILFLAAMSGYDLPLLEARDSNQLQEAFILFDTIINARWFTNTSIILFLNKSDLLEQKLSYSPIGQYFPDYAGEITDEIAVRSYFKVKFLRLNRSSKKEIYTHFTCATDTSSMRVIMGSVTDIVLRQEIGKMYL